MVIGFFTACVFLPYIFGILWDRWVFKEWQKGDPNFIIWLMGIFELLIMSAIFVGLRGLFFLVYAFISTGDL